MPPVSPTPTVLKIDPRDDLIVALRDIHQADAVDCDGDRHLLQTDVPVKQTRKFDEFIADALLVESLAHDAIDVR